MGNTVLQKSQRDAQYELIRVIANMLVLLIHVDLTYSYQDSFFASGTLARNIIQTIFFCCNGLFFILSGKFAFTFDEAKCSYRDYYFKKVIYLVLPMLFYMTVDTVYYTITRNTGNFAKTLFVNVTNDFVIRHYWFMFALLFDLMVVPIFAKSFRNMSDKMMLLFLAIGFLHLTLYWVSPLVTEKLKFEAPFNKFHFFFFLGGILDRVIAYFGKKKLLIIGLISFVIGRILVVGVNYPYFSTDLCPLYLLSVISFWIIICEIYKLIGAKNEKIKHYNDNVILFLGKCSFQVYLIHYLLLEILATEQWKAMFTDYPVYVLVSFVCLFFASLILSQIIDFLILGSIQKGLKLGYSKLTEEKQKD